MNVAENFRGKNIFITGGSGFLGKVLIEKILRTVPDVGDIYVLLRTKKGKTPQERLNDVFNDALFSSLKESNPGVFAKVKCIEGDSIKLRLGINENDRKIITDNVDIIYNCAASVRFDDTFQYSILVNVRSTRELIELAKETKHLKVFVHVSTAFCNADKTYVEEKLYPSHGNWREAIRIAEEYDSYTVDVLTQKYIHPLPNTYTYAKSLSEHTVYDLCYGQIPTVIVRPSIVINMRGDPMPGWTDNLNGPIGLFTFGGTGLLRVVYGNGDAYLDTVTVDVSIRVLILATCECLQKQDLNEIQIYNNSQAGYNNITLQEQVDAGIESQNILPFGLMCWYPKQNFTMCNYDYYISVMLFHIIPALLIDLLLRIVGQKPRLYNLQKKVYIANNVLYPFMKGVYWNFKNNKTMALESKILSEDLAEYSFKHLLKWNKKQLIEYELASQIVVEKNVLKVDIDLETRTRKYKILWILDIVCSILSYVFLIWFIRKTNIIGILYNSLTNYVSNL